MAAGLLRARTFALLMASAVVSMFGTSLALVAMPFAMFEAGYGAGELGGVLALRSAAMAVFVLLGGVVADRWPRHRVMVGSTVVSAFSQGSIAVLLLSGTDRFATLAALCALTGVAQAFYFPSSEGMVPQCVAAGMIQRANTWLRLGRNGAMVVGGGVSGGLIVLVGPAAVLLVEAGGYVVAAALRAGMRLRAPRRVPGASLVAQVREGWRELAGRRWLWVVLVQFAVRSACYIGAFNVLGPLVAAEHLDGARGWGLVLASFTAGFLAGTAVLLWLRPRRLLFAAVLASLPFAALLGALAVPLPLPVTCVIAVLAGTGVEVASVNWVTAVQQEVPEDRLSRVFAYDALGSFVLAPLALGGFAPLSSWLGVAPTLWLAGALVLVPTVAVLCVAEVRQLRRSDVSEPVLAVSGADSG